MQIQSHNLAILIEPALLALSKPSGELVREVLAEAQALVRQSRAALRQRQAEPDMASFELGVATTFTELLATMEQRSYLDDAMRGVAEVAQGVDVLHVIAFLSRSGIDATQGDLADQLGIDRGNFNRRIRRLEELDLVRSQRRGRKLTYSLSALAYDILTELRPGWRAIHPITRELLESEGAAERAAAGIVMSIHQAIARENVREFHDPVRKSADMFEAAIGLLGVPKFQTRSEFGTPAGHRPDQAKVEFRVERAA